MAYRVCNFHWKPKLIPELAETPRAHAGSDDSSHEEQHQYVDSLVITLWKYQVFNRETNPGIR